MINIILKVLVYFKAYKTAYRIKKYFINKRKTMWKNRLQTLLIRLKSWVPITQDDLKDFTIEELESFIKESTRINKMKEKREKTKRLRKKKQKAKRISNNKKK